MDIEESQLKIVRFQKLDGFATCNGRSTFEIKMREYAVQAVNKPRFVVNQQDVRVISHLLVQTLKAQQQLGEDE